MVDAHDVDAVIAGLRDALTADGPAILVALGISTSLDHRVPQRVAVVVETSGSTGHPKRVALSADALLASAAASDAQLGGPGQWLLALPAHYIAGINVIVRSLAAGTELVAMDPANFTAERFVAAASELRDRVRYTSLVPVQLGRLIGDDAAIEVLRRFDRVLVGGQALPVELAARALELGINLTRTYGSSETSGGCVYDGVPIGDTRVRIVDGRVELSGSVLAEGYLDDERRTAFAFRDGWYRTDDTGTLVDGVLTVTGRLDDLIISGGVKVSLAEVQTAVRLIPGLAEAVVVSAPHPEWGEAPVVVSAVQVDLDVIRDAVGRTLGRAAAPAQIVLVDSIPLLPGGKPDRVTMTALALR